MEYYDVLDKNRNNLNYVKKRDVPMLDFEYNQGTSILIFNNKKLLITKRSKHKSHPLMWEFPGGCSLVNEDTIDTIKREISEEIGIVLNNNFSLLDSCLYKKQFVDIYVSSLIIDIKKLKLQQEEVCDIKFVSNVKFMKMVNNNEIAPSAIKIFETIKDNLSVYW